MVQITVTPIKGDVIEKGEPKTVRSAQRWFYDFQVLGQLTRDKYPLLQHVRPTQIALAQYGLGDAYKGRFGSGLYIPKEGSDCM